MLLETYRNADSLKYNVHVLIIYMDATLSFAKELVDTDGAHLSDEDKALYADLADQLERASFEAEKLRKRVKRGE